MTQLFFGAGCVFEVLAADFGLEQKGVLYLRAVRVLLAEEFVLSESRDRSVRVGEHAAFFREQIGYGCYGCGGFGCARVLMVDGAESIQHFFIAVSGALLRWKGFELIAQMDCVIPWIYGLFTGAR